MYDVPPASFILPSSIPSHPRYACMTVRLASPRLTSRPPQPVHAFGINKYTPSTLAPALITAPAFVIDISPTRG